MGAPRQRGRVRDNFVRGVRLAWDASPGGFVWVAGLGLVTAILPPIVVWLGKHLVDLIAEGGLRFGQLWPTVLALGILGGITRALTQVGNGEQWLFSRRVSYRAM